MAKTVGKVRDGQKCNSCDCWGLLLVGKVNQWRDQNTVEQLRDQRDQNCILSVLFCSYGGAVRELEPDSHFAGSWLLACALVIGKVGN